MAVQIQSVENGLASRKGMRSLRYGLIALAVPLVVFLIGFIIFSAKVANYDQPADIEQADAIIVLTGGQARLGPAVSLLSNGRGEKLLISGVHPSVSKDAIRAATGGAKSLFDCCVELDYLALDTIGNAAESVKWIEANAFKNVIMVTSNYHMPRAMLELRRNIGTLQVKPFAIVSQKRNLFLWLTDMDALRVLVVEYGKYLRATLR